MTGKLGVTYPLRCRICKEEVPPQCGLFHFRGFNSPLPRLALLYSFQPKPSGFNSVEVFFRKDLIRKMENVFSAPLVIAITRCFHNSAWRQADNAITLCRERRESRADNCPKVVVVGCRDKARSRYGDIAFSRPRENPFSDYRDNKIFCPAAKNTAWDQEKCDRHATQSLSLPRSRFIAITALPKRSWIADNAITR